MDVLEVERLGGLAGFGGGRLRSRGTLSLSALSAADQEAVAALFRGSPEATGAGTVPDGFRYRITLDGKSIEAPEAAVPAAVRDCVRDELI